MAFGDAFDNTFDNAFSDADLRGDPFGDNDLRGDPFDDAFDDADLREIEIRRGISPIISFKLISLVKGILFDSSIKL